MKVVGDADFLYFLNNSKQLRESVMHMSQRVILTPNRVEFQRLIKVLEIDERED